MQDPIELIRRHEDALHRRALQPIVWNSLWERFFLLATGVLATTILLKVAAIQWLELIYLVQIVFVAFHFIASDLRTVALRPYLWLAGLYTLFMAAAISLAIASLRFTFYIPIGLPTYGQPVYITISRVVEFLASTFNLLWLADLFTRQPNKLRFTMRIYFWIGVLSALYSYLSYPIQIATGNQYGSYLVNYRFRGFYNEGGPYGLYLLTVFFVGLALYTLRWEPVLRMRIGLALLPVAFYKSYSKAAFSALLLLLLINGLFTSGIAKRIALLGGMALLAVLGLRTLNLNQVVSVIDADASTYERASHLHIGDGNFVYGRIAARFIVPRMIAAHPYTGIGWGNYGVLRNDPQYRGASVWSDIADQPGLGILGYAAEFGIPLLAVLGFTLLLPYFYLRIHRAPTWMTSLALMSPLVHFFGAQLNVTYPWIVTAFALALNYAGLPEPEPEPQRQRPELSPPLSWAASPAQLGSALPWGESPNG